MFINFRHFYKFKIFLILIIFFILNNCQLKDPDKVHGINFLKNRSNQLVLDKTNKNDVINLLGNPHIKSDSSEGEWIYIERIFSKGKLHKLGQNVLKENNVLVISFNKYGLINKKKFLDKDDLNDIAFSNKITESEMQKKSFAERFLNSIKEKMYGGK
tara:strand:- start:317 stop:790 length:474 start_codon:yes stop_codon:yes gene_type:complete